MFEFEIQILNCQRYETLLWRYLFFKTNFYRVLFINMIFFCSPTKNIDNRGASTSWGFLFFCLLRLKVRWELLSHNYMVPHGYDPTSPVARTTLFRSRKGIFVQKEHDSTSIFATWKLPNLNLIFKVSFVLDRSGRILLILN